MKISLDFGKIDSCLNFLRPETGLCDCIQDGISIKFGINDSMWCCKTTEDKCILDWLTVKCEGTALSLSDQCHNENYDGSSCNYYPLDEFRLGDPSTITGYY